MFSHGIVSGGLFFLVGCIYDRFKTRILFYYSGLVTVMPLFAILFLFLILGNISFPGTSGFIGEFLFCWGFLKLIFLSALLSTFSIILTAIYSIWLYNRLVFNELKYKVFFNFSRSY